MALEFSKHLMGTIIKVVLRMICIMEQVSLSEKMVISMEANGIMVRNMVKGHRYIHLETCIREHEKMAYWRVKEF